MSDVKPSTVEPRRTLLKKVDRFAAVTAPAVTLLLAASTKPAKAVLGVA
jgi:hypothetical protein